MLDPAFRGFLQLGAATVAALFLHWLTVEALAFDYRSVFQGGIIAAALIGIVCLANPPPAAE